MRTEIKVLACLAAIAAAPLLGATAAAADETYTLKSIITLPAGQVVRSFDISFVSQANGTYGLALSGTAATGVGPASNPTALVVDVATGDVTELTAPGTLSGSCSIPPARDDFSGLNGLMIIEKGANADVWAGNGPFYNPICAYPGNPSGTPGTLATPSSVVVWDLHTGQFKGALSTGGKARADELCWNPKSDVVLIANDDPADNFITFFDEDSGRQLGKIHFDGTDPHGNNIVANGIEQCAYDPRDGKFYINIPQTGGTAFPTGNGPGHTLRISARAPFHIEADFEIPISSGCVGPQGLAVGPGRQLALGCGGTNNLIISDQDGSIIATVFGAGGTDEAWYNPGSNHYYFAASTPAKLFVEDAGPAPTPDTTVPTNSGSHSVAADPVGNLVYVPIRGTQFGGTSTLCSTGVDQNGKHGVDATGCIAVFTAPNDADDCVPKGTPVVSVDPDGNPNLLKVRCRF
jgi:hypothetical protein